MPTYAFKGRNNLNEIVRGSRQAASPAELRDLLRRENVVMTGIEEKSPVATLPKFSSRKKVNAAELAAFTRQFSVMLDASLPLVQCLEILSEQQTNKYFRDVLRQVRQDVEEGATLHAALGKHTRVFDGLYVHMVEAGETGGILDIILQRLSIVIEKMVKLRKDIVSASIYPSFVVGVALIAVVVIMVVVIPQFEQIFLGLLGGEPLPLPTRIVMAISSFVAGWGGLVIIAVLTATIFGLRSYYKTAPGRLTLDRILLKLPILGSLIRKIAVARFSRILSTLLGSGVPILEALDIAAKTAGNLVVENAIIAVRDGVERGEHFVEPLKQTKVFPDMVSQMVGVGEQTGTLDTMLGKIADFYEEEVDAAIKNILSMIEPALIGFLGVTIGGIVIAMYLPLFTLVGKLAGGAK